MLVTVSHSRRQYC